MRRLNHADDQCLINNVPRRSTTPGLKSNWQEDLKTNVSNPVVVALDPHTLQFPSRLLTQSRDLIESHQQRHRHRHHHSHLLWPFASPFTSPPSDVSSSDSLSV
ncbi:hypothetical protein Fmac_015098 [Flemingia macrophylla]|uniref:Uncharacterized protein n=1 Tax=Flemingia macrophylla TaxID=520843 RepID=A0ABD1MDL1_9FABA